MERWFDLYLEGVRHLLARAARKQGQEIKRAGRSKTRDYAYLLAEKRLNGSASPDDADDPTGLRARSLAMA